MSTAAPPEFDFSEQSAIKRFGMVNRERLRRVVESLSARQREFIELLPLLFHINHPLLPGYIGRDAPFGISDYTPTAASLRAALRHPRALHDGQPGNHRLFTHQRHRFLAGAPS
jgi:adenylate cyclase class 1